MSRQQWRGDEHKKKGWKENTDSRNDRAPKSRNEITDERCGDHHRPRADHADSDGDEELALIKPTKLLDKSLFEKGHDDEAASECQRPGLKEKEQEFAQDRARGGRCQLC